MRLPIGRRAKLQSHTIDRHIADGAHCMPTDYAHSQFIVVDIGADSVLAQEAARVSVILSEVTEILMNFR